MLNELILRHAAEFAEEESPEIKRSVRNVECFLEL